MTSIAKASECLSVFECLRRLEHERDVQESFAWSFRGRTHHDGRFEIMPASGILEALRRGLALPDVIYVQGPITAAMVDTIVAAMQKQGRGPELLVITGGTGVNGKACGQGKLEELRAAVGKFNGTVLDIEAEKSRAVRFRSDIKGSLGDRLREIWLEQLLSTIAGGPNPAFAATMALVLRINTANVGTILEALLAMRIKVKMVHWLAAEKLADEYVRFAKSQGHMKKEGNALCREIQAGWRMLRKGVMRIHEEALHDEDDRWDTNLAAILSDVKHSKTQAQSFGVILRSIMTARFAMVMAMAGTTDVYVAPATEGLGVTSTEKGTASSCERFVKPLALGNLRALLKDNAFRTPFPLSPAYDPFGLLRIVDVLLGRKEQKAGFYSDLVHKILTADEPRAFDLSTPEGRKRRFWLFTDPWEECDDTASFVIAILTFAGCELKFLCLDGERCAQERALQLFLLCPRI